MTRNLISGPTITLRVDQDNRANNTVVKLFCFDVDVQEGLIVFGGETDQKPFVAVHSTADPQYTLVGYSPQMVTQKENKLKEMKKKVSPEEYQLLLAAHNKETSELKMAHLTFPLLSRCIFNVKLISTTTKQRYIIATDFNSTLLICELLIDNTLNLLSSLKRHSDLIQAMVIHKNLAFTCSSDKLIMVSKINANFPDSTETNQISPRKLY